MKQKIILALIFLMVGMLSLAGCGGIGGGNNGGDFWEPTPNPTPTPIPINPTVNGTITDGRLGPTLAGVTIKVYISGGFSGTSTMTDSEGNFSFQIPPNTNVDLVASKSGYAGTRYQRINLPSNASFSANMVMKKVFNSNWTTNPPVATITGISPGQTVWGSRTVTVSLTGGQDPSSGFAGLAIGKEDLVYASAPGYPFSFNIDTSSMPDGLNFYYVIAYDVNNNCVINNIPVTLSNGGSTGPALQMTKPITLEAFTLGEDMQFSELSQSKSKEVRETFRNFNQWQMASQALGAELNSACYVHLTWEPEFSAAQFKRYKIYRASSASGPWTSIGYSYYDPEKNNYFTYDSSAQLTPYVTSYYKVVPVNNNGLEGKGQTNSVTPLGRYEVNLAGPANEATGISLTPTFSWSQNLNGGLYKYYYYLQLESLSTLDYASYELTDTTNSLLYSQDWANYFALKNNQKYQWDIIEATVTRVYSDTSKAVSKGLKGYNGLGSYNGAFVFTTVGL